MSADYRPVPADEIFAKLSGQRQAKIAKRASELIAEEMALRDIRKARQFTQEQVAKRLGGKQVYVSKLESRSDAKLSTLRDYVKAIGGELEVFVTFPEGKKVKLADLG
jgi:ParB-like chromosome segregation protein Spo0J